MGEKILDAVALCAVLISMLSAILVEFVPSFLGFGNEITIFSLAAFAGLSGLAVAFRDR